VDRAYTEDSGRAVPEIPDDVHRLLTDLWSAGHAAYVVGGSLRDELLGRPASDWDLATSALPDRLLQIFPDAVYENAFGTVAVRRGGATYEITTFRTDHDYADFRRPHRVEFGESIELDLARRDFTVNAMAWGAEADGATQDAEAHLVDPFAGRADLERRLLRAVGDPDRRFSEDALRIVRAIRLATTLGFEIEPATLTAIQKHAALVRHLSSERIAAEIDKLLAAATPSVGLRILAETGVLEQISPELAGQRGVGQNKIAGEDLWDHTLRTVDAAPRDKPILRLTALVHDIGKPATASDGHFYRHERVGAEMAEELLARLRYPRSVIDRVTALVRQHMFAYDATWTDTAVRRFIAKVGVDALGDLFELRRADNIGSGREPDAEGLAELRRRVGQQLDAEVALDRSRLAVDGDDLIAELGLPQGPHVGRILDELLERVIADPRLNDSATLLLLAESMLADHVLDR
jgi:putative nucleotidyltransferase with HDIG domain